jgi:hypothetical protein
MGMTVVIVGKACWPILEDGQQASIHIGILRAEID